MSTQTEALDKMADNAKELGLSYEQPAQQEIDWKDQYEKQKRRADMWVAKYEADIGPLEKAGPVAEQPAQQEPVAWVDVKHTDFGPYDFHGKELLPVGRHDLYTTPQAQPAPEIAIADAYRAGVDSGIAAEREACARVCDAVNAIGYKDDHWYHASEKCAEVIRARGNT